MARKMSKDIGTLYYIESEEQKAIKVGFAMDMTTRFASLQTGNPATLKIIWEQHATREVEEAIHAYLKPFRIGREWYPDDGLVLWMLDELGYALLDKAEADVLENGAEYETALENACLTLSDVRRVLPPIVKSHAEWIAAGRPADPGDAEREIA